METWRLITTWGADPTFNMGLDEALLLSPTSPPTVRFYTWKPDTLSLGYFQRFADVEGTERAGAVVRRITGGGAIHHVRELTFSITAPLAHRVFAGPVRDSYVRVHAAIARALAELGVEAGMRGDAALDSDRADTGMCFHVSTDLDLVWGARKGVGSAQRRKGGRVLHHGSIKLGSSPLEGAIATVAEHAPDVTAETLAPVLRRALAEELDLAFEAGVPDADERGDARRLGRRYVDPAFVRRR
jgi:lipoyl(octanoyl) transferase